MNANQKLAIRFVEEHWTGHIGTHYRGCWVNHVHCLAVYLLDLENEDD